MENPNPDVEIPRSAHHGVLWKLRKIVHEHDQGGVVKHLVGAVGRRLNPKWHLRMRKHAAKQQADRDFDRRYGVNTFGDTPLHLLGIAEEDLAREWLVSTGERGVIS